MSAKQRWCPECSRTYSPNKKHRCPADKITRVQADHEARKAESTP